MSMRVAPSADDVPHLSAEAGRARRRARERARSRTPRGGACRRSLRRTFGRGSSARAQRVQELDGHGPSAISTPA